MNDLTPIKITSNSEQITVSARDLHDALQISERFNSWMDRMIKYGFEEGTDYLGCKVFNALARQNLDDYQITIEMAKQICMIQRTEIGKKYREYFLQLEKEWNSPEKVMARALEMAHKSIASLTEQLTAAKPRLLFADAVAASDTTILVRDLAKILKQEGCDIGGNRLFAWLRDHDYLCKSGKSKNMPTQKSMELGLFKVREGSYINSKGDNIITKTCLVTGKGQIYFVNKFKEMQETA